MNTVSFSCWLAFTITTKKSVLSSLIPSICSIFTHIIHMRYLPSNHPYALSSLISSTCAIFPHIIHMHYLRLYHPYALAYLYSHHPHALAYLHSYHPYPLAYLRISELHWRSKWYEHDELVVVSKFLEHLSTAVRCSVIKKYVRLRAGYREEVYATSHSENH